MKVHKETSGWKLRMEASNGSFEWKLRMEFSNRDLEAYSKADKPAGCRLVELIRQSKIDRLRLDWG